MTTTTGLKERLQNFEKADFERMTAGERRRFISELAEQIGSTDAELRDKLIFKVFFELIQAELIEEEQKRELFRFATGTEGIFFKIDEADEDAVFTRAFASLWLALLLYSDRNKPYLGTLTDGLSETFLRYLETEQDVRGYVDGKGWAHSTAHIADAIDEWFLHPACDLRQDELAGRLIETVCGTTLYTDEEDERVLNPLEALLSRGYPQERLITAIESLPSREMADASTEERWHAYLNTKQFLRTVYFRFKDSKHEAVAKAAESVLKQLKSH